MYRLGEFAAVHIVAALLSAANAYCLYRRRAHGIPAAMIAVPTAGAAWCAASAFEAAAIGMSEKLLWAKIAVPFGLSTVALFLLSVDRFVASGMFEKIKRILALFIPIPIIVVIAWTNEVHGLYWSGFHGGRAGTGSMVYEYGPGYALSVIYAFVCVVIANRLLFPDIAKKGRVYLARNVVMSVVSVFPIAAVAIMRLDLNPFPGLNLLPTTFVVTSLVFFFVVEPHELLKSVPIARAKVLESLSEAVFVLDTEGLLIDYNKAAIELLKGIGKMSIGSTPVFPKDWERVLSPKIDGKVPEGEYIVPTATGEGPKSYSILVTETWDHRKRKLGTIIIVRDVTERVHSEEELRSAYSELRRQYDQIVALEKSLRELSTRDGLTGLLNRRSFNEIMSREFERSKRINSALTLIVMDIDNFKACNDAYGHLVGDSVLLEFTRRMNRQVRSIDYFFRFGDDEFVLLVPDLDLLTAKRRIELILEDFTAEPMRVGARGEIELRMSFSAGAAEATEKTTSPEALFALADRLLYKAKALGRSRIEIGEVLVGTSP